ncbi:LysR family transcriptional regulator [Pelagibacterium lentulum]|uniref:LysR family transcriptional regulator n=1 Tax=Pelagibacterium lentulum TaxID=2029865 RepID=UPI000F8C8934|nr:LysR family transcriptional regulator [Pelagibacterium lentulum]
MKKNFTIVPGGLDGTMAFLKVAEKRSFRAAAIELGISPSAVSQAVRKLEDKVGVALVARTTRSVGLTQAGQRFLERAGPAMAEMEAAFEVAHALGATPSGLLRLTVPRAVVGPLIEPVLPDFCAQYPEIQVEIVADSGLVDIVDGGFDAGIRLGELVHADMIGLRLTPAFQYCIVGAPSYFARWGIPEKPSDLRAHRAVNFRQPNSGAIYRWEFVQEGEDIEVSVDGPLTVNDEALMLNMALEGIGLAYIAAPLVQQHLKAKRLRSVLELYCPESPGLFLYYPSRAQTLPKLRAFIDFIAARRSEIAAHPLLNP